MRWVLRLVRTGVDGQSLSVDVMEFIRPDGLVDIAKLGLTLAEAKQLLAQVQQEVVAAHTDNHAMLRPDCRSCGGRCHVKSWGGAPDCHTVRRGEGAAPPVSVCWLWSCC